MTLVHSLFTTGTTMASDRGNLSTSFPPPLRLPPVEDVPFISGTLREY